MKDHLIKVVTLNHTPNPQSLCYLAMHQDYSSTPVSFENFDISEQRCGEIVVDRCLKFGHWGVVEHPSITLGCRYVPHDAVMQMRTHRVGVSFDVQSFRYTSQSVLSIDNYTDLERAFYFRPVGHYTNRIGRSYDYTAEQRLTDMHNAMAAVAEYKSKLKAGHSEEHARNCLPICYRQHFVLSLNLRSALHVLNLRRKADAQLECQWLAEGIYDRLLEWAPEIVGWYDDKHKKHLAP